MRSDFARDAPSPDDPVQHGFGNGLFRVEPSYVERLKQFTSHVTLQSFSGARTHAILIRCA